MPPRKRILYYNHTRKVSGGEQVLLLMTGVLDRSRYEALAACPLEGDGFLDDLLRQREVEKILPAPLLQARFSSNPLRIVQYVQSFATTILAFRGTIRAVSPDLIHANSVRAGIVATLATTGRKTPVLWHVQDDLPAHPISTFIRLLAWLSRRTHLVAVSAATARAFAGRLRFGPRLTVLYNTIDPFRFHRKTGAPDCQAKLFRSQLGLDSTHVLLVTVGLIHPRKGLIQFVETFAEVAAACPHAHLAIVGAALFNQDHLYEARLRDRIQALGLQSRVHLTGQRHEVPAILRAADVFVLNAVSEPFGLVILEAIASGTPVMATAVGGIPEIVEDGVTAILNPTPAKLIAAVRDPHALDPIAEAAFANVLPRFSVGTFSVNLHRLYESIL